MFKTFKCSEPMEYGFEEICINLKLVQKVTQCVQYNEDASAFTVIPQHCQIFTNSNASVHVDFPFIKMCELLESHNNVFEEI